MKMTSDLDLLRNYARGSEKAFTALVTRHLNLVYSAALRQVRSSQLAEEVAQSVFSDLARNASLLKPDTVLAAWLYQVTRRTALNVSRSEGRRQAREQIAVELAAMNATSSDWTQIEPWLDEAMETLDEPDRAAILLRYFENQSLRAVGKTLGVGEDAAQKRVSRAVERLREFFSKRDVTIGASGLAVLISANAVQAAPAGLAATLIAGSAATTSSGAFGLLKIMTTSKIKVVLAMLAIAVLPVAWQWNEYRQAREESAQLETRRITSENEFARLQTDVEKLRKNLVRLDGLVADASNESNQNAEIVQKFKAWKQQLRERLLAADYQWPEDGPFVRIPKAMLPKLNVYHPISPPGTLKQEMRELFGLAPQEREQMEGALQKHFAAIDELINNRLYETNHSARINFPKDAVAINVWSVPALGDAVKTSGAELQSEWQTILGEERWAIVAKELESSGTDTLRRILSLDSGERSQDLAAWIDEDDGKLLVMYGWGEQNSMFTSGGADLSLFLPGAEQRPGTPSVEDYFTFHGLPEPLTRSALDWIHRQAVTRLGKKGDQ